MSSAVFLTFKLICTDMDGCHFIMVYLKSQVRYWRGDNAIRSLKGKFAGSVPGVKAALLIAKRVSPSSLR